jgi:ABC-2 type transport system permease protein
MLGKVMPNLVIAMINMLTILAIGILGFGVPFQGSFRAFVWRAFMYVFSGLGLGLLVSTISDNQKQSQQTAMLIMLIGLVLGGFMFPRYLMPPFIRILGNLFPLTYFIPIARGIVTKGIGVTALWEQVVALAIYVVLVMGVAVWAFNPKLE